MYSKIYSGMALGIDGMLVSVEADVSMGLPGLSLVGYLASSVKEAGDRVRTALKNVGYFLPSRKITVNLSPADVRKEGAGFDLAIAVSILLSIGDYPISTQFNKELSETLFLGELGLDGRVLPVTGVLPILDHAVSQGIRRVVLPSENCLEASYLKEVDIISITKLEDIIDIIRNSDWGKVYISGITELTHEESFADLADIKGQDVMKRGIVIATAGFHNILLTGAAGSGKSMISKCIPGIMPPLTYRESLELTKVYSVAGLLNLNNGLLRKRPFRSPHQNVTEAALIGGGANPKPGEVSLATGGVLFLDEFPEYSRGVIESLRQPMEDKQVVVSRLRASYTFPARFMLVAARNNCPCGFYPDKSKCRCNQSQLIHYQNKISHPIMDRIDIRIEVRPVKLSELFSVEVGMSSAEARELIGRAREMQERRFKNETFKFNSEIPQGLIEKYILLGECERELLKTIYETSELTARGYFKALRLARTIADVEGREFVNCQDIEEAMFFRNKPTKLTEI